MRFMVLYAPGRTTSYPDEKVESGFRFHFLGGGEEVGNVGLVLEDATGTRMLLDYGLAPSKPPRYPAEAPRVMDAVITHAHIDHLGMAPWLNASHRTELHATPFTVAASRVMWRDCYKVSSIEGYPLAWDKRDLEESLRAWREHGFHQVQQTGEWDWSLLPAGHIPGAAMLDLSTPEHDVLITGDFDTRPSRLVPGAAPKKADILFMEGTYGGRNHPDRIEEEQRLLRRVESVVEGGGTVLIPSFAMGRGQDVLMILQDSDLDLDIHYDGMGKILTRLMLDHPEGLKDPEGLERAFGAARKVSSKSDRKKALEADVIVSTSGMLEGGPSIWYLNRLRHDSRNSVFLTGYQAEGTGGRRLLDQGRLPIFGSMTPIELPIDRFDLSTHAGHDELITFAEETQAEHVILYHTDHDSARPPLAADLRERGFEVHCPMNRETYTIQ